MEKYKDQFKVVELGKPLLWDRKTVKLTYADWGIVAQASKAIAKAMFLSKSTNPIHFTLFDNWKKK